MSAASVWRRIRWNLKCITACKHVGFSEKQCRLNTVSDGILHWNGKTAARRGVFQQAGDICYNRLLFFGCTNDDCIEIRFYRANLFPQYAYLRFHRVYFGFAVILVNQPDSGLVTQ